MKTRVVRKSYQSSSQSFRLYLNSYQSSSQSTRHFMTFGLKITTNKTSAITFFALVSLYLLKACSKTLKFRSIRVK